MPNQIVLLLRCITVIVLSLTFSSSETHGTETEGSAFSIDKILSDSYHHRSGVQSITSSIFLTIFSTRKIQCAHACTTKRMCGGFHYEPHTQCHLHKNVTLSTLESDKQLKQSTSVLFVKDRGQESTIREEEQSWTRLLIAPFNWNKDQHQVNQLDLQTHRVTKYPFTDSRQYKAIVRTKDQIFIAFSHSIVSAPLDREDKTTISEGTSVNHLAVDEGRKILILAEGSRGKSVYHMTLDGKDLKTIYTFKRELPKQIALNNKERLCFVGTNLNIVSFNYDGENVNVLLNISHVQSLVYVAKGNVLYFFSANTIYKWSEGKQSKMVKIEDHVTETCMICNAEVLYISTDNGIIVYKTSFSGLSVVSNLPGPGFLCLA